MLAAYIQDQGFDVWDCEGYLVIQKIMHGQVFSLSWDISHDALLNLPKDDLIFFADQELQRFEWLSAEFI